MGDILDAREANSRLGGASFPLRHRLKRAIWNFVWLGAGVWTPTPFHGWRRSLLRAFGAKIHPRAKVYPGVRVWYPPNLVMEAYSCLGPGVNCYNMAKIALGEFSIASQRSHLCAGTHDIDDESFQLQAFPINIGARAWVAAESFVGPGVDLGEGSVLGARGVAMKNLDAWGVYVGNPARFVRRRGRSDSSPQIGLDIDL